MDDELWDDDFSIESPIGSVREGFLRYYVVLSAAHAITVPQCERLDKASREIEQGGECIFERTEYEDTYVLLCLDISKDIAPQAVIDDLIIATNGADPFLRFHFFMVNTHKPSKKEIADYLAEIS